jgi:hypothetical protein
MKCGPTKCSVKELNYEEYSKYNQEDKKKFLTFYETASAFDLS